MLKNLKKLSYDKSSCEAQLFSLSFTKTAAAFKIKMRRVVPRIVPARYLVRLLPVDHAKAARLKSQSRGKRNQSRHRGN